MSKTFNMQTRLCRLADFLNPRNRPTLYEILAAGTAGQLLSRIIAKLKRADAATDDIF